MEDGSDDNMEEIIVIRAVDPDENVFQAIMDALHGVFAVIQVDFFSGF